MLCIATSGTVADNPKDGSLRPISLAKGVIAIWFVDAGLVPQRQGPQLILAAWPDGRVVWSNDRVKGGTPYRQGQIDPKQITGLLKRFERDGLFVEKSVNQGKITIDGHFVTILVRNGNHKVELMSSHDVGEAPEPDGDKQKDAPVVRERRLNVIRELPPDELMFRFVWADTRLRMTELLPSESTVSTGRPIMKSGIMSWQDGSNDKQDNK